MMYNFRSVWPLHVTRRRSSIIDILLAAIILPLGIAVVIAKSISSRER